MKQVEYFYDVSSPYAYLAHEEIAEIARAHGAELIWRPFFLGGLFKSLESQIVPFNSGSANKQDILKKDMYRWAESRDLPFQWPTVFPMMTVRPMRVLVQLDGELHAAVARHLFRAYWAHDQNIGDPMVLHQLLESQGLDAERLLAQCETPEVKQKLVAATQEALDRGACGAPTFFVNGDLLVWGQDRLEFVGKMLDGWRPKHG
jgi:2-hydroxychromene-2-carboxylate isomerase